MMLIILKISNGEEASNECFPDNFSGAGNLVHFKFALIILVDGERSLIDIYDPINFFH